MAPLSPFHFDNPPFKHLNHVFRMISCIILIMLLEIILYESSPDIQGGELIWVVSCYNLPDRDIERLQRVQNCLARVVCEASRFSRSKPLLNFLHWLPVKYRIRFKLCTPTFKALHFTNLHISLII